MHFTGVLPRVGTYTSLPPLVHCAFSKSSDARAGLAQLVEHPPCKRKVVSSIPTAGTTIQRSLHMLPRACASDLSRFPEQLIKEISRNSFRVLTDVDSTH